jgi:hypothetical protein
MEILLVIALAIVSTSAFFGWRNYQRVLYITRRGYVNSTDHGTWYAPDLPRYGVNMMTLSGAYQRERNGLGGSRLQVAKEPGTWMLDD